MSMILLFLEAEPDAPDSINYCIPLRATREKAAYKVAVNYHGINFILKCYEKNFGHFEKI